MFSDIRIILILILSVTFLSMLLLPYFTTNAELAHKRLSRILDVDVKTERDKSSTSLPQRIYRMVSRRVSRMIEKQVKKGNLASMELRLKQAGISKTPLEHWTLCVILAFVGSVIGIFTKEPMLILALAAFGAYYPNMKVKSKIEERQFNLRNEMPDFLDLVSVTFPACANIEETFQMVAAKLDSEISREFNIAVNEIRYGRKKREVFNELALRTGIKEVASFVVQLNQAETFGTGLEHVLIAQAKAMRQSKKELAQERGNKAGMMLMMPATLLLLVSVIIMAGPFIMEFIASAGSFM